MRITEIKPEYVDNVPALSGMKEGVLYINKNCKWTLHLCPCGCARMKKYDKKIRNEYE